MVGKEQPKQTMAAPKILSSKDLPKTTIFKKRNTGFYVEFVKLYQEPLSVGRGEAGAGGRGTLGAHAELRLLRPGQAGFSRSQLCGSSAMGGDYPCPSPGPHCSVPTEAPLWY